MGTQSTWGRREREKIKQKKIKKKFHEEG